MTISSADAGPIRPLAPIAERTAVPRRADLGADLRVDQDPAWSDTVVGVIGGLGPAATALFLQLVVDLTPAVRDQDHLDLIVLDHSTTADRTGYILDPQHATDPGPGLARDAARLAALGAAFVSIPCNTAHHFIDEITAASGLDVVDVVEETAHAAVEAAGSAPVAVLATDGTRAAGVYQRALERLGADVLLPDEDQQGLVMSVIYDGVKAGGPVDVEGLLGVIDGLRAAGAGVVVMGCTELSVVYAQQGWSERPDMVDSVETLARATVARAGRVPRR